MFTFCLCYIMYGGCSFRLLADLIISLVRQTGGADLVAFDPLSQFGIAGSKTYIDEVKVSNFLDEQKLIDDQIAGYSFVTADMRDFLKDMGYTQINITVSEGTGSSVLNPYQFSGIDRNYLNVVDKDTIIISEHSKDYEDEMSNKNQSLKLIQDTDKIDIADAMFIDYNTSQTEIQSSDEFNILNMNTGSKAKNEKFIELKMIIPEGLRDPMSLDTTKKARLTVSYR